MIRGISERPFASSWCCDAAFFAQLDWAVSGVVTPSADPLGAKEMSGVASFQCDFIF